MWPQLEKEYADAQKWWSNLNPAELERIIQGYSWNNRMFVERLWAILKPFISTWNFVGARGILDTVNPENGSLLIGRIQWCIDIRKELFTANLDSIATELRGIESGHVSATVVTILGANT